MKAGKYVAKAHGEVVLGESAKQKTPFIECYFQIQSGDRAGDRVRWTSYMSEKTWERTVQALETCGWKGDDIAVFSDGKLHGLDKNEVEIVVEGETFTGQDGNERESFKVTWVNRLGYLNTEAAMSEDTALAFAARMNALIAGKRGKSPSRNSTPASDVPDASDIPDIPF